MAKLNYSKDALDAGKYAVNLIKKNVIIKKTLPNTGLTFDEKKILQNSNLYLKSKILDKEIKHYYKK